MAKSKDFVNAKILGKTALNSMKRDEAGIKSNARIILKGKDVERLKFKNNNLSCFDEFDFFVVTLH